MAVYTMKYVLGTLQCPQPNWIPHLFLTWNHSEQEMANDTAFKTSKEKKKEVGGVKVLWGFKFSIYYM